MSDILTTGRPDMAPGIDTGLLKEVTEAEGAGLVGDHAAGATVLEVSSGGFRDAGTCRVNDADYAYVRDDDSLSITPALAALAEDGTPVLSLTPTGAVETTLKAQVDLDMDGDPEGDVYPVISGEVAGYYRVGTADAGAIVKVRDTTYGYEIVSRPIDQPLIQSLYVHAPRGLASRGTLFAVTAGTTTEVPLLTRDATFSTDEWTLDAGRLTYHGPPCVVVAYAGAKWAANGTGYRRLIIRQGSAAESLVVNQIDPDTSGAPSFHSTSGIFTLADGETLQVDVRQTSGASLNLEQVELRAAIVGYQQ